MYREQVTEESLYYEVNKELRKRNYSGNQDGSGLLVLCGPCFSFILVCGEPQSTVVGTPTKICGTPRNTFVITSNELTLCVFAAPTD